MNSRSTRRVVVGTVELGADRPVAVQSMCATKTTDIESTLSQIHLLKGAGADIIRLAVDSKKDVEALKSIRQETRANLVVDLQENYRLAREIAGHVQKFRYNPGHLHHHEPGTPIKDKVKFLADVAGVNGCAIRIGVNFGSLGPETKGEDPIEAALNSAAAHAEMLEGTGFFNFLVSLKSSDPQAVQDINRRFAASFPEIPLHLGLTEAGMPPEGETKTRLALEPLLAEGIGDTIRVSLTLPDEEKDREVIVGRQILEDVANGRLLSAASAGLPRLNVISCPSCSRVENRAFVQLAREVKEAVTFAAKEPLTIAVMGCRVNGPGETDHADFGLWCAPTFVNLKRKEVLIGRFSYEDVVGRLVSEINETLAKTAR